MNYALLFIIHNVRDHFLLVITKRKFCLLTSSESYRMFEQNTSTATLQIPSYDSYLL